MLREHEAITREVLKAHGGIEVKTMGDGFLAVWICDEGRGGCDRVAEGVR